MNRCLVCSQYSTEGEYHHRCLTSFFGLPRVPSLDLGVVTEQAAQLGISAPGVMVKVPVSLLGDTFRAGSKATSFLIKLPNKEYAYLPEYEHLTMHLASLAKIPTVEHALYRLEDGMLAYFTKRIDRIGDRKVAMEDFCQLGGRLTEDKYRSSYEQLGKIVKSHSRRLLDVVDLWYLLLFCFVTGNSDMHLKNFSLYAPNEEQYILSPAYDLLPTNLIIPEDNEESALTLRGKRNKLTRKDFIYLAELYGIQPKTVEGLLAQLVNLQESFFEVIEQSFLPNDEQEAYKALITERMNRLR